MSSTAISGKPGGGKSYYATQRILEELEQTTRAVVTNVPLNLEEIVRYFAKKGREDIDVYGRVQLLEHDQVKEFWRHRGPDVEPLPSLTDEQIARGERPDLDGAASKGAVLYALDELHEHLNSRQWKSTGPAVLYYIAKHRHLGDDVLWMTQSIPNVDKQWRSVTQEYLYCRNFRKEMWKGFSRGGGFRVESYLEPYTGTQQIQWHKEYKLNKDIARCYQTSTVGAKADTGERRRGIPLGWLFGFIGLAVVLVSLASIYGPELIIGAITGDKKTVPSQPQKSSGASSSVLNTPRLAQPTPAPAPAASQPDALVAVPVIYGAASEIMLQLEGKQSLSDVRAWVPLTGDAVILSGPLARVSAIAEAVRQMDTDRAQVRVRAVIIRQTQGTVRNFGLGGILERAAAGAGVLGEMALEFDPAQSLASGGVVTFASPFAARLVLETLAANQAIDEGLSVIGRPEVTVLSGQEATLTSGRDIPVPVTTRDATGSTSTVEYRRADFSFKVRPTVQPSGLFITIDQSNTEVLSSTQVAGSTVPTLSTQTLVTSLRVSRGDLIVMGGVEQEFSTTVRQGVPVLRDIPLVNGIFSSKRQESRRECVWLFLSFDVLDGSHSAGDRPVIKAQKEN